MSQPLFIIIYFLLSCYILSDIQRDCDEDNNTDCNVLCVCIHTQVLEATFNYPYDICYDGEGGYWIAEAWGKAIRKYAVE